MRTEARLHDGKTIELEILGTGPDLLLPVDPEPAEGQQADELRKWGVDPARGRALIDGLSDAFRVIAFDYEGHVLANPKPDTLTPDNLVADLLSVADAAGASRFAYYGYSWLALAGLQLAIRTDRLSALVMGGFPPIGGPYPEMLRVTLATHELAGVEPAAQPEAAWSDGDVDWGNVEVAMSKEAARQFVTLYEGLRDFDDRSAQSRIDCPRLCFAGSEDTIVYDERWGGVTVDIAGAMTRARPELEAAGWDVEILDGLDHMTGMQPANVLPLLRPWLTKHL